MEILLISLLVFGASMVGTVTGFGISAVMVPVIALFYSLPETLLFVGMIHFFGDIWKITLFKGGVNKKFILTFGLFGAVASFIGATLTLSISEVILHKFLGLFLISYLIFVYFKPNFSLPHKKSVLALGGTSSGFMAGIIGIGGFVQTTFISAFKLPKEVHIATLGFTYLFIDSVRLLVYAGGGTRLESTLLWGFLIFIPVSFLGASIARRIIRTVPEERFHLMVAVFLALAGVYFLVG